MNKYEKVEELLKNYKMMKISIENMKQEIEYIKQNEDGISGIDYDGVSTSKTYKFTSTVEDTVLSRSEKIHYLERNIAHNKRQIKKVDKAMEGLSDDERTIITGKYIEGNQWWQVAGVVGYSERHCKRIRNAAIKKLILGMFGEIPKK